jgi:hypothetical protein
MPHFAELNAERVVVRVVSVAAAEAPTEAAGTLFLKGLYGDDTVWVQTSYNTKAGIYCSSETNYPDQDQSKAFRKNYAGIGYSYDTVRDAFMPPVPPPLPNGDAWVLDEFSCTWVDPMAPKNISIGVDRV